MAASSPDGRTTALTPADCPAFILAGGRSSRFGSDKALVAVDGSPLLKRLQQQLQAAGHSVYVVADRRDRYATLDIECILDETSEAGPLAGVIAALRHRQRAGEGWLLALNCDLLTWDVGWFTQLALGACSGSTSPACIAPISPAVHFVSASSDGLSRPEPLPCLLHTSGLTVALAALNQRELAIHKLLQRLAATKLVCQVGPAQWTFNTTAELARLTTSKPKTC